MAMRGTRSLRSVLDARLIFDFTAASVVIVVDNARLVELSGLWKEARGLIDIGDRGAARQRLMEFNCESSEERLLVEFCMKAIENGLQDRIEIFGLSKPDIIQYLPVGDVVPGAHSWEELVAEWNHQDDFKQFLRGKGAKVSARNLGAIAGKMDSVPDDFVRLRALCLEMAGDH